MLYIKDTPTYLYDFVGKFFSSFTGDSFKGQATFYDSNYKKLHCSEYLFRSFDDILECVRTYFPDTTEESLLETLVSTVINYENEEYYLTCFNCTEIHQPTCGYFLGTKSPIWDSKFNSPETSYDQDDNDDIYKGNIVWKELLLKIGINNYMQLSDYINTNKIIFKANI